ncbi:MAG: hypothetical protein Q9M50_10135 [Methylococcales bacterium]|nr:hypothetical protein [Methylococcales bacterium]
MKKKFVAANKRVLENQQIVTAEKLSNVTDINQAQKIRTLCVLLVLEAVVSFRSAPRILALFNLKTPLELAWIPHFTSVINWNLRVGGYQFKTGHPAISKG